MWQRISRIILRNRLLFLTGWILLSVFMGYQTSRIQLSYDINKAIPLKAQANLDYEAFKQEFGDEGNLVVIAIESKDFFELEFFRNWNELVGKIDQVDNVQSVTSIPQAVRLVKNTEDRKFDIAAVFETMPDTQEELDSLKEVFYNLPFYDRRLYNADQDVFLMLVSLDKDILQTVRRVTVMDDIYAITRPFAAAHDTRLYYTGLPVIRHFQLTTISGEIQLFLILAVVVTILVLLVLFRSWIAVVFPLLIIASGVFFSMGLMTLIGFKVTVLTSLIPSLLIVIGIPNSVYLINKYHIEFKKHGNKIKALTVIIERVGYPMFFTNLTTAVGFGVFYFTGVQMLMEFGIITFISVVMTFFLSLIITPVIFSYLPKPRKSDTNHLNNLFFKVIIDKLINWTFHHGKTILITSVIAILLTIPGLLKLHSNGYILDDISHETRVYQDQQFFEKEFNGILPFEIIITKKPVFSRYKDTIYNAIYHNSIPDSIIGVDTVYVIRTDTAGTKITSLATLEKIAQLQDVLADYSCFSTSLSILDGMMFARQAYYNGSPRYYSLPDFSRLTSNDARVGDYLENTKQSALSRNVFTDPEATKARVSLQMADIGSDSMPHLMAELQPRVDSIFQKDQYDVVFTGTSVVALEGFNYLIKSLLGSVSLALLIIAIIMTAQFRSLRMLLLALIPNLIPLLFTAAIMGYFNIPLKPSTVLIFSVAFGMAVDYSIHILAKYRQELVRQSFNVRETVRISLQESGMSMVYTSIILFFGFIIFAFSEFEGTKNLGILTSMTLLVAFFTNMLLLPTLLLKQDKKLEALHRRKHGKSKRTFADLINEQNATDNK